VIIHGDPELTAIVARLEVVREYSAQRYPERHAPRLMLKLFLRPARSSVLGLIERYARSAAALISPGTGWQGPEADCIARYVRNGTDHVDLCANGLTEFSLHLMALTPTPDQ
jgi:hypothetical protein